MNDFFGWPNDWHLRTLPIHIHTYIHTLCASIEKVGVRVSGGGQLNSPMTKQLQAITPNFAVHPPTHTHMQMLLAIIIVKAFGIIQWMQGQLFVAVVV